MLGEGRRRRGGEVAYLTDIRPHFRYIAEELQREYCADDAEGGGCYSTVAGNCQFQEPCTIIAGFDLELELGY